jgi:hypothetical protein
VSTVLVGPPCLSLLVGLPLHGHASIIKLGRAARRSAARRALLTAVNARTGDSQKRAHSEQQQPTARAGSDCLAR